MDRRTNSQKSFLPEGFCHFRDSWKLSIYRAFKINTIHTHSAPFRGMLLLKILFYVFAQVNILEKMCPSLNNKINSQALILKDQTYRALAPPSKNHFQKFILLHSASTSRNFEFQSLFYLGRSFLTGNRPEMVYFQKSAS